MEFKTEKTKFEEKIVTIKNYTKKTLRILVSSLVGIIAGLGMFVLNIFWSMHFIPEISYSEKISFPIISIALQALFILGPQFIAGFISTNIKKALITGIVVTATLGTISFLFSVIQGIVNSSVIILGTYLGGYYAEQI